MKLSLCINTFNEEKNIHYPLNSAYDLVDEVIIIDGGSADKTVAVAKAYGPKVKAYIEDNPPMFHINKQKAIERASGEWILQLDADEELSDELKKEIQELLNYELRITEYQRKATGGKEEGLPTARRSWDYLKPSRALTGGNPKQDPLLPVAFWIPRKNFFLTRFLMKGGKYPDYTIRFYKKGVAKFPCRDVHENVKIKGEIGYLKNPILHYADPDFSRYLMRWDRYTTLEAEILLQEIKNQKSKIKNFWMFIDYFKIKPIKSFFSMYFRHKGFMDGFPGFVFSLFSSIRFWVIYIKWWNITKLKR